jgi:hypothetical protein
MRENFQKRTMANWQSWKCSLKPHISNYQLKKVSLIMSETFFYKQKTFTAVKLLPNDFN